MKWSLLRYSALTLGLMGCQHLAPVNEVEIQKNIVHEESQLEKTVKYGAIFANEYNQDAKVSCAKYKQLYQQGDWRAGWVLAMHVGGRKTKICLKTKEAVTILTTLESEKKIPPDLIWLSQFHLNSLIKQRKYIKQIARLRSSTVRYKKQVNDLKDENKSQLEKIEALKAIETSININ